MQPVVIRIDKAILLWNHEIDFSLIRSAYRVQQAGFYLGLLNLSARIEPWSTLEK
jgi:hypothetical protein